MLNKASKKVVWKGWAADWDIQTQNVKNVFFNRNVQNIGQEVNCDKIFFLIKLIVATYFISVK